MAPADRGPGRKQPRRGKATPSIRAAAQSAAGRSEEPKPARKRAAPLSKRPKRRSRTSDATRRAAAEALEPTIRTPEADVPAAGDASFPDYEVKSESWDPWEPDSEPPGRTDPDFDAQRTLGQWLEGVIPPDAQVHFANAGREFAQGVQVTVDHHTGKRRAGPDGDRPGGPSRIEIQ